MKFCKFCGKPLIEGEICDCPKTKSSALTENSNIQIKYCKYCGKASPEGTLCTCQKEIKDLTPQNLKPSTKKRKPKIIIGLVISLVFLIAAAMVILAYSMLNKKNDADTSENITITDTINNETKAVSGTDTSMNSTNISNSETTESPIIDTILFENTDVEYYNINIYLSNFTELGFRNTAKSYQFDSNNISSMIDLAWEHCMINFEDKIETGVFNLAQDYFTARISADYLHARIKSLFKITVNQPTNSKQLIYDNGYYYSFDYASGEHFAQGFALLTGVVDLGNNQYEVSYDIYGYLSDYDASNTKYYAYSHEQANAEFGRYQEKGQKAIIHATSLKNSDSIYLILM